MHSQLYCDHQQYHNVQRLYIVYLSKSRNQARVMESSKDQATRILNSKMESSVQEEGLVILHIIRQ